MKTLRLKSRERIAYTEHCSNYALACEVTELDSGKGQERPVRLL